MICSGEYYVVQRNSNINLSMDPIMIRDSRGFARSELQFDDASVTCHYCNAACIWQLFASEICCICTGLAGCGKYFIFPGMGENTSSRMTLIKCVAGADTMARPKRALGEGLPAMQCRLMLRCENNVLQAS